MTNKSVDKKENSIVSGLLFGLVFGVVTGLVSLLLFPFIVLKFEEPSFAICLSSILISGISGFAAGKAARRKSPGLNPFICGLGSSLLLIIVLMLASTVIKPDITDTWVTYTSFAIMLVFSLIGASGGGKSKLKKRKRGR